MKLKDVRAQIEAVLRGGDILFVVPPFATAVNPVLGPHILSVHAEKLGYKTEILYLNILLAAVIGFEHSEYVSFPPAERMWMMLHERLFARSAFDLPPLGKKPEYCMNQGLSVSGTRDFPELIYESGPFDLDTFMEIEKTCTEFLEFAASGIASKSYQMVGCSTRMGQTNCSVALLNRIKRIDPTVVTLIGGADCKGEQAKGIASLTQSIDYIFSGESDVSFPAFLEKYRNGARPAGRIIDEIPEADLDRLPMMDFESFIHQASVFLGDHAPEKVTVCYETSRGCWWGAKNRCRFCSEDQVCRKKSSAKVIKEVGQLSKNPRVGGVYMCDVAMPLSYKEEVFPRLVEETGATEFYYQSKVNLSLQELVNLKQAGVGQFTFGIEALSTGLLKTMNKGTTAVQNLNMLRNSRSVGIRVDWLLLWGFPGDDAADYRNTLALLPLIRHLQPPMSLIHMILGKCSPYFENREEFRIKNVRPMAVYKLIFPEYADFENLASWYAADYPCQAHENPDLMKEIGREVGVWQGLWKKTYLNIIPFGGDYVVFDNRDCSGNRQHVLDEKKAREIMKTAGYSESENQVWALEEKLGVLVDSRYVPLVTGAPELLRHFSENENES